MKTTIKPDTYMAGVMYMPFCRTIPPPMSEWERDIKTIRDLGFTCLHGFAEWHMIEREKGNYDFSQTDYLIELCAHYGVTPLINVATADGIGYYSPRWLMEEYIGCGLKTADGDVSNPSFAMYKFPCLDDPWYQTYAERYLSELADHYAGDDRVGGWVLWGEPSLGYKGKPICYCEHTIARFRRWLEERYESIGLLNEVWGTDGPSDFAGFSTVRPPVGPSAHMGSYAAWQDFRAFMDENACGHIRRADELFKARGAAQPTIAELFCYFGSHSYATIDPWKLAEATDIVGVSDFKRPGFENSMMMTIADSISKHLGKTFFVVELLGGPKTFTQHTINEYLTPSDEEIAAEAIQTAGSGAKGLMYWCYRPRLSDREAGEFGLATARGIPLPRAKTAGRTASQLAAHSAELLNAHKESQAAIFESTRIQRLCPADSAEEMYNDSVQGALKICLDLRMNADFINEDAIQAGRLSEYRVLLLPFAYMLDPATAQAIASFTAAGGTVAAEYPLGIKKTNGDAYIDWPGGILREIFGIENEDALYLDHPSRIEDNLFSLRPGIFVERVRAEGARILYNFGDAPLVTRNSYQRGQAYYMGFQFFKMYGLTADPFYRSFFSELTAEAGVEPYVKICMARGAEDAVTSTCLLLPDGDRMVTCIHHDYGTVEGTLYFPAGCLLFNFLTGAALDAEEAAEGVRTSFELKDWGFLQIRVRG